MLRSGDPPSADPFGPRAQARPRPCGQRSTGLPGTLLPSSHDLLLTASCWASVRLPTPHMGADVGSPASQAPQRGATAGTPGPPQPSRARHARLGPACQLHPGLPATLGSPPLLAGWTQRTSPGAEVLGEERPGVLAQSRIARRECGVLGHGHWSSPMTGVPVPVSRATVKKRRGPGSLNLRHLPTPDPGVGGRLPRGRSPGRADAVPSLRPAWPSLCVCLCADLCS